jgi:hypothetical protein
MFLERLSHTEEVDSHTKEVDSHTEEVDLHTFVTLPELATPPA